MWLKPNNQSQYVYGKATDDRGSEDDFRRRGSGLRVAPCSNLQIGTMAWSPLRQEDPLYATEGAASHHCEGTVAQIPPKASGNSSQSGSNQAPPPPQRQKTFEQA
ncbi:unnamed protein product [Prorocentrum cordatum]|uniref:Uncharacterized protein n=1 Tax=Prorocentrum cordatum TaxID=2364126 RepID=A0ABN9WKS7_9DINO|nr:unnamed protein product [Polarella glacialis]